MGLKTPIAYDITAHFSGCDVEATTRRVDATCSKVVSGIVYFYDGFGNTVRMVGVNAFVDAEPVYTHQRD